MARPKRNNAEYFTHDADMRNDVKIKALRKNFRHAGYAIWCFLLEVLSDSDFFEIEWSEAKIELLAGDFDISSEELKDIVDYCVNAGLLKMSDDGKLYSESQKRRFKSLISKREKDRRIIAEKRRKADQKEKSDNGVIASDNGVIASDNGVIASDNGVIASDNGVIEKEKQQEEEKEKENFPPHPLYKEKEKKEEEKKERGDWDNAHTHTRAYTREEATLFDGMDGCYKQQKTGSDVNPLFPPAPLSPVEAFRAALKKRFKFDFSMVEEEFLPIVSDWLEYKQGRSEKYKTQKSFELLCAKIIKLSEGDAETARAIIEQSMANNWAGLFTLKDDNNTNTRSITNGQRTYKSFDQIQREETDRACAEHLARQLEKIALKDMERQW